MKYCNKCEAETNITSDGRCRICENIRNKKYRLDNAEKLKASKKISDAKYRIKNIEKLKIYIFNWKKENKLKVKANLDKYRAANREKINKANAARKKENPQYDRINQQNRRARIRANGGILSRDLIEKLLKLQKGKCPCCGEPLGDNFHLDHIMPLSKGGANKDWNMQLLRQKCNNQKHAKDPIEFMQSKGFLL